MPAVEADAAQLRQVVMNLVLNAAEAIGEGEGGIVVRVRAEAVAPGGQGAGWLGADLTPGPHVYLEVEDTGCGMTEEMRRRIFEPFYTTKFMGRGLGLSAVLGIVRGHHGALQVDSAVGRGTRFRILLPALPGAAGAGVPDAPADPAWRGQGRVLLVDDEDHVRRLGRRMLERLGFEVVTVEGGAEALALLERPDSDFRCIVLDLAMPGMDGAETLAALQARGCRVPVLISSGYSESELEARFAGRLIAGVLPKPYELGTMTASLRKVCPAR